MGCGKDIIETCGVPRFLFSDFPLGNSAGKPNDVDSQRDTLSTALELFDQAEAPRTTRISPQQWADDGWKRDFMNIETISAEQIERRRREFAKQKDIANRIKQKA